MDNVKLTASERLVLLEIYKASSSLQLYTLFRRSHIESGAFFKILKSLSKKEMVAVDDILVNITQKGLLTIAAARNNLIEKPWRAPLPNLLGESRPVGGLYVPRRTLLSKDFKCSLKDGSV